MSLTNFPLVLFILQSSLLFSFITPIFSLSFFSVMSAFCDCTTSSHQPLNRCKAYTHLKPLFLQGKIQYLASSFQRLEGTLVHSIFGLTNTPFSPPRYSNKLSIDGITPWSEYPSIPVQHLPSLTKSIRSSYYVDELGTPFTFPAEFTMRYLFQNPETGSVQTLYIRDLNLHWTEIIAGIRSNIVPSRYENVLNSDCPRRGPMTKEWFKNLISSFTVTENGKLMYKSLIVEQDAEDFDWKVETVLPATITNFCLGDYTPDTLVETVRNETGLWHLDSYTRASAILYNSATIHDNSTPNTEPCPFSSLSDPPSYTELSPIHSPPPYPSNSLPYSAPTQDYSSSTSQSTCNSILDTDLAATFFNIPLSHSDRDRTTFPNCFSPSNSTIQSHSLIISPSLSNSMDNQLDFHLTTIPSNFADTSSSPSPMDVDSEDRI
jgi:hypothetical protein